tara:strand:+ start:9188 stop:9382 length:195 start_codon:yes stop_codon:yes gene_type:complete
MSIKIEIECDAYGCSRSCDIEDNYESDVSRVGWHTDPLDGYQHYCPDCWQAVKKKIEDQEDEDQ